MIVMIVPPNRALRARACDVLIHPTVMTVMGAG
jgi:hypothetical protein